MEYFVKENDNIPSKFLKNGLKFSIKLFDSYEEIYWVEECRMYNENNEWFVLSNSIYMNGSLPTSGHSAINKLGYKYSWQLNFMNEDNKYDSPINNRLDGIFVFKSNNKSLIKYLK